MLTAFQEVEDNLAASRILENEALAQDKAVNAAHQALLITQNQYASGTASYLNVIIAQTAALNAERSAADILGRRMSASVLLIKALGGGWSAQNQDLVGISSKGISHAGTKEREPVCNKYIQGSTSP